MASTNQENIQNEDDNQVSYTQRVELSANWNYSSFFNNKFLSDCTIKFDGTEMPAHIFVLANGSDFFYDMFRSDMKEATTHIVEITHNPMNLLPRAIEFLYTGKISYKSSELMAILSIARFYRIDQLIKAILDEIDRTATKDDILSYVDQCYDQSFSNELEYISQFITKFYSKYTISELSDKLDVKTFVLVIKPLKLNTDQLISTLTEFLGDYDLNEDETEKEAVLDLFDPNEKGLKDKLSKAPWVPSSFLNKLRN